MRIVRHRSLRKARLWLGECPDLRYPVASVLESSLPSGTPAILAIARAAAELCIPTGGRTLYGLLGAEFVPARGDKLSVRVHMAPADATRSVPLDDPLVSRGTDSVYVGLTPEYAPAVLDRAVTLEQSRDLGPGILSFNCAAHGLVGSCEAMFRLLTDVVIRLLTTPNVTEATDEQLEDLVFVSSVRESFLRSAE